MVAPLKDQWRRNGLEIAQQPTFVPDVLGDWADGAGPLYRRLARALRSALGRGELPSGLRLPPERALAHTLSISRSTVVAAYELLERDGVLDRRQGSGTRIVESSAERRSTQRPTPGRSPNRNTLFRRMSDASTGTIDFLGGYLLGADALPASLLAGVEHELTSLTHGSGYAPLGYPPLREAIAGHLTSLGLPSSADEVLVTSGAQQAIHLAGWHHLQPGDTALVERPTYPGALDAFSAVGGRLAWVPTGRLGASVEALFELVTRSSPRLVYVIPTFQNPTGGVMPEQHRRAVARLVESQAITLVDDQSVAALALDAGEIPPPIAAFAPEAPILTIGSLSKVVWGGLRVGWIRAPAPLIGQLGRLKAAADLGGSLPGQVLALRLFEQFEALRRERCAELARRCALLTELLARHVPSWSWDAPAGGCCLWVRLPGGDATEFSQVALRHGVSVVPGSVFSADAGLTEFLRLPFGLEPAAMEAGVERLGQAWRAYVPAIQPTHQALTVIV
jgi:DNA-binding transcriptional MocR family regulator